MVEFSEQRKRMVEGHLRPCGVRDQVVLNAAKQIQRENFLPSHLKSYAYLDDDIKLDDAHFMMRPNDLLRLILALKIQPTDNVLDIAGSAGYSSVILSFLGNHIVALEDDPIQSANAKKLADLESASNIQFVTGSYEQGDPKSGPYEAILLQRAYTKVPETLLQQLVEGGRLVFIKQSQPFYGQACLVEKHHDTYTYTVLFEMCAPYFCVNDQQGFSFQ